MNVTLFAACGLDTYKFLCIAGAFIKSQARRAKQMPYSNPLPNRFSHALSQRSAPRTAVIHRDGVGDLMLSPTADPAIAKDTVERLKETAKYTAQPFQPANICATPSSDRSLIQQIIKESDTPPVHRHYALPWSHLFTQNNIETKLATSQYKTNNCWIAAALNVLRIRMLTQTGIDYKYSVDFIVYWNILESANVYLEKIIESADSDPEKNYYLSANFLRRIFEGGSWQSFCTIVKKHGLVPDEAMLRTFYSENASVYIKSIKVHLHEQGGILHQDAKDETSNEALQNKKNKILNDIAKILTGYLGKPPESFLFKTPNDQFERLTPLSFLQKFSPDINSKTICAGNMPDISFNTRIRYQSTSFIVGMPPYDIFNFEIEELKIGVRRSIEDKVPVFFSASTLEFNAEYIGLLSTDSQCTTELFDLQCRNKLSKGDRFRYNLMNKSHAMVFIGCDNKRDQPSQKLEGDWKTDETNERWLSAEQPALESFSATEAEVYGPKWKVMDSNETKKPIYMTDSWFDAYVCSIIIDPKYLSAAAQNIISDEFSPIYYVSP